MTGRGAGVAARIEGCIDLGPASTEWLGFFFYCRTPFKDCTPAVDTDDTTWN